MSDWETYADAAERLGMTADAIRHRARRMHWRRMRANDGRTLIMVPDDIEPIERINDQPMIDRSSADRTPEQFRTVEFLQERVAELQADLERERKEYSIAIDREREERIAERDRSSQLAIQLLNSERSNAEIGKAAALAQAEISHKAAEIKDLQQTLAELHGRPWWRRLAG